MTVYVVFGELEWDCRGVDVDDHILGVYSTREKAIARVEALEKRGDVFYLGFDWYFYELDKDVK